MATATFYLLDEIGDDQALAFMCERVCEHFRSGKRVLVMASDQHQAEALDELLWRLPTDAFVPHNLSTEGGQGSPVEISWPGQPNPGARQVVINLSDDAPQAAARAQIVIDVVPQDEAKRALARERFKQYRQLGLQLNTTQASLAVHE